MKSLVDICEPVFLYICSLNRMADKCPEIIDYEKVREDIFSIFINMKLNAVNNSDFKRQLQRVILPLKFFMDSMIYEMNLPFSEKWDMNRLAYEDKEMTGDKKFFDVMENILEEHTLDSDECLKIMYTCIGLGFTGMYKNKPEYIQALSQKILARVPELDVAKNSDLCPEAYKNIDKRKLIVTNFFTGKKTLWIIGILALIWIVTDLVLYFAASGSLLSILHSIINRTINNV